MALFKWQIPDAKTSCSISETEPSPPLKSYFGEFVLRNSVTWICVTFLTHMHALRTDTEHFVYAEQQGAVLEE